MPPSDRRGFLKSAGVGAALWASAPAVVRSAQESRRIILGVIGPGGMGRVHVQSLCRRADVSVAWVCDVDESRRAAAAEDVEKTTGIQPRQTGDLREIFDDVQVDAVLIATPDHWHAPAAILALDAGKHVYVEKPCCHNIREGRLMIEAAARSGKLMQVGTQSRSTECVREAIQRVREGEIGEVLVAKAWNSQRRGNIGKSMSSDPPPGLDYDLWVGPAPLVPYRRNMLPGRWRWWYDFGCGDMGNDGVHDIDVALWGLGVDTHPERAACLGGKYFFDDDQQFPDTQYAAFEYAVDTAPLKKKQLIYEQRIWSPYVQEGYEAGGAFYGTQGLMVIGHMNGWKLYGEKNQLKAERTGDADLEAHHTNFLDCIRGEQQELNAPIDVGHRAATIVHLGNIASRVGDSLQFDPQLERITNSPQADALVQREYRRGHWAVPAGIAS